MPETDRLIELGAETILPRELAVLPDRIIGEAWRQVQSAHPDLVTDDKIASEVGHAMRTAEIAYLVSEQNPLAAFAAAVHDIGKTMLSNEHLMEIIAAGVDSDFQQKELQVPDSQEYRAALQTEQRYPFAHHEIPNVRALADIVDFPAQISGAILTSDNLEIIQQAIRLHEARTFYLEELRQEFSGNFAGAGIYLQSIGITPTLDFGFGSLTEDSPEIVKAVADADMIDGCAPFDLYGNIAEKPIRLTSQMILDTAASYHNGNDFQKKSAFDAIKKLRSRAVRFVEDHDSCVLMPRSMMIMRRALEQYDLILKEMEFEEWQTFTPQTMLDGFFDDEMHRIEMAFRRAKKRFNQKYNMQAA